MSKFDRSKVILKNGKITQSFARWIVRTQGTRKKKKVSGF